MLKLRSGMALGVLMLIAGVVPLASAQNFPTKPVRIVTSPPGGGPDMVSRLIAPGLTARLGQQVIVDNRPAGIIPAEIVASAQPDGYTVLIAAEL